MFQTQNYECLLVISNLKRQMFRKFSFIFTLKHCFSPVHLWVAKYSCISVWNDWETISRWHTLQLHHGGSALRQQATRPTDWVHLKGILAQKNQGENVSNVFSTCRRMHAISNSRCQSNVLFAMNVYGKRKGWYGEEFWLAAAALRLLHWPRCSADAAQEKKNVSNNPWVNWDQL